MLASGLIFLQSQELLRHSLMPLKSVWSFIHGARDRNSVKGHEDGMIGGRKAMVGEVMCQGLKNLRRLGGSRVRNWDRRDGWTQVRSGGGLRPKTVGR